MLSNLLWLDPWSSWSMVCMLGKQAKVAVYGIYYCIVALWTIRFIGFEYPTALVVLDSHSYNMYVKTFYHAWLAGICWCLMHGLFIFQGSKIRVVLPSTSLPLQVSNQNVICAWINFSGTQMKHVLRWRATFLWMCRNTPGVCRASILGLLIFLVIIDYIYPRQSRFWYHPLDSIFKIQAKSDFVFDKAWFSEGSVACI
jgi:hypothetical protein